MAGEVVAAVELVGRACFHAEVEELMVLSFPFRHRQRIALVINAAGSAAVAHHAVTPEIGIRELGRVVHVPVPSHDLVLQPCAGIDVAYVVVVSELVSFVDLAVWIVEVVLHYVHVSREITFREVVDVTPVLASEKIADGLVVVSVGEVDADASLECEDIAQTVIQIRIEHIGVEV